MYCRIPRASRAIAKSTTSILVSLAISSRLIESSLAESNTDNATWPQYFIYVAYPKSDSGRSGVPAHFSYKLLLFLSVFTSAALT